ncbi:NAD(P)-binding domain-containing protein, partial [Chloroflexota bacterium]
LDAPVTGGVRGAKKATLTIMVGANRPAYEFCEPVLRKLKGRFEPPIFTLSLAAKDLRLGVDYTRDLNVPVRLVQDTSSLLNVLIGQGLSEKNLATYITLLEKATGVEVRA